MLKPILVVDDDRKTVDLIRLYLERNGYPVLTACCDEHQAIDIAHARKTGLIILNLMLPQVDGLQVCRVLSDHADVPIILLTAKSTEENKLEGLDEGTDDYVTNTFSPRELTARVRAILRRGRPQALETVAYLASRSTSSNPSTAASPDLTKILRSHAEYLKDRFCPTLAVGRILDDRLKAVLKLVFHPGDSCVLRTSAVQLFKQLFCYRLNTGSCYIKV